VTVSKAALDKPFAELMYTRFMGVKLK